MCPGGPPGTREQNREEPAAPRCQPIDGRLQLEARRVDAEAVHHVPQRRDGVARGRGHVGRHGRAVRGREDLRAVGASLARRTRLGLARGRPGRTTGCRSP
jgi:hypothetical protein